MVGPLKAWKKSSKATHPQGKATHPQGGGSKRSIQERLTVASNIIVALTAVAALVVALITLHMQSQDRTAAAQTAQQDRTAAAQTAQMAFANRIVSWWTASSKGLSVDAHIQNDNAQPFEVWVVYLPSDNQSGEMACANRIVSWWTASSKGLSVDAHIQNDNAQPFEVWVVYLPSDNQFGPTYIPVTKT